MISKIASTIEDQVTSPSGAFSSSTDLSRTLVSLSELQQFLSSIQRELRDLLGSQTATTSFHPDGLPTIHPTPSREPPLRYAQQIQFLQDQIADLKSELSFVKSKVRQTLPTSRVLCTGPLFLIACLLAISLFAITVIILAALGLAGILPQINALMVSQANMLWAVVSASIVTAICLVSVCSVFFIKK